MDYFNWGIIIIILDFYNDYPVGTMVYDIFKENRVRSQGDKFRNYYHI